MFTVFDSKFITHRLTDLMNSKHVKYIKHSIDSTDSTHSMHSTHYFEYYDYISKRYLTQITVNC